MFGYDNVEVVEGGRVPGGVPVAEEAEIVREDAGRYVAGDGLRSIVKDFNGRGLLPPRAGRGRRLVVLLRVIH